MQKKATVINVKLNGQKVQLYETRSMGEYTILSLFMTIPPQQDSTFEAVYSIDTTGAQIYQFIMQKQIGSINNELSYDIKSLMSETVISPLNFDTLEKNNAVHYNTPLLTDRVLLIRLK